MNAVAVLFQRETTFRQEKPTVLDMHRFMLPFLMLTVKKNGIKASAKPVVGFVQVYGINLCQMVEKNHAYATTERLCERPLFC